MARNPCSFLELLFLGPIFSSRKRKWGKNTKERQYRSFGCHLILSDYSTTTGDSGALLRMLSMPLKQPALAL